MSLLFFFRLNRLGGRAGQTREGNYSVVFVCKRVCDLKAIKTALTLSGHRNGHGTCLCVLW